MMHIIILKLNPGNSLEVYKESRDSGVVSRLAAPLREGRHQGSSRARAKQRLNMGYSKNFFHLILATSLLFVTCDCFRTVKLGGKDCTFKGEKVCKGT